MGSLIKWPYIFAPYTNRGKSEKGEQLPCEQFLQQIETADKSY